jgi:hypothetical protein
MYFFSNHSLYDNVRVAIIDFSENKRRDVGGWRFIIPDYDASNVDVKAIVVGYHLQITLRFNSTVTKKLLQAYPQLNESIKEELLVGPIPDYLHISSN